jgi:hypothetical protein
MVFALLPCLVLALGCSSTPQRTPILAGDEPEDADHSRGTDVYKAVGTIELGRERDGLVVYWKDCSGSPKPSMRALRIDKLDDPTWTCLLEHADPSRPQLNDGKWVYGSKPEGYELGDCKPFEANVEYGIIVDGDADGTSSFLVLEDESIKKTGGWCPPGSKAGS